MVLKLAVPLFRKVYTVLMYMFYSFSDLIKLLKSEKTDCAGTS